MVKFYFSWLCFFSMSLAAFGSPNTPDDDVTVKVIVQDKLAIENQPFRVSVVIHRPAHQDVDESSFQMDGKRISTEHFTEGKQSSVSLVNGKREEKHQAISCYYFEIKGKEKGTHTLPAIQVMIGGQAYSSEPVSYLVNATEKSGRFNLSALIDAPKLLYPGQSFTITYRVSMAEAIEILYDNLPLLDLKDFQKQGKCKSRVFYQGNRRIEEFSQTYEVEQPGSFDIEDSFLEGRAYTEDLFGRRRYKHEMLRAEAESVSITVQEFPLVEQPHSFNGAVGNFTMNVCLDSGNQVCVGDKLKLKITFKGKSGLTSVRLPNLSGQEGFKDSFRFNDLPILAKIEGDKKVFICELRPMKEDITEIPSFEFSFYNPSQQTYTHALSIPIPITLLPMKLSQEPILLETVASTQLVEADKERALEEPDYTEVLAPSLIEIQGVYPINVKKVHKVKEEPYLFYWLIAFVSIISLQYTTKYFFFSKKQRRNSAFYFQEALKNQGQLQNYQLLLEKAFLMRLKEHRFIKEMSSVEQLGPQGIAGEVKSFIQDLSLKLFSGQHAFSLEESQAQAKALYKKIGENF